MRSAKPRIRNILLAVLPSLLVAGLVFALATTYYDVDLGKLIIEEVTKIVGQLETTATTTLATLTGNVGIGTSTPSAKLEVYASSTATALTVQQDGTGNIVEFKDGGTAVFTIADGGDVTIAGNVGIGTTDLTGSIFKIARTETTTSSQCVSDTFTDTSKIATSTNLDIDTTVGEVKLATTTEGWTLNETNCNALSGWHWYTTNGRSACWSKTLADSVSWNKGVGDDTDNPGSYTCASGYTLQQRMQAAAAGEWYKIVSNVAGTDITSAHNGSAGYSVISALAIADCVDGTRDLCSGDGCLGNSWSTINSSLRDWAGAAGKSALPYCADDGCTSGNNDYETACGQNSGQDTPLDCTNNFYLNRKVCDDGDSNYSWIAACGSSGGTDWDTSARNLGKYSCSTQNYSSTSYTNANFSFRVVVRP